MAVTASDQMRAALSRVQRSWRVLSDASVESLTRNLSQLDLASLECCTVVFPPALQIFCTIQELLRSIILKKNDKQQIILVSCPRQITTGTLMNHHLVVCKQIRTLIFTSEMMSCGANCPLQVGTCALPNQSRGKGKVF